LDDEGLVVINRGSAVLLQGAHNRTDATAALRFETDECGLLRRVESSRSILNKSALPDSQGEDVDDEDVGEVPDPTWALAQDWLYDHPEIAVVSQGVERWCGDDDSPIGHDIDPAYVAWGTASSLSFHKIIGHASFLKIAIA
jgi:hypothetical protein